MGNVQICMQDENTATQDVPLHLKFLTVDPRGEPTHNRKAGKTQMPKKISSLDQ
jgi:hypothetical protein